MQTETVYVVIARDLEGGAHVEPVIGVFRSKAMATAVADGAQQAHMTWIVEVHEASLS